MLIRIISDTYQGNESWTGIGVFALLMSAAAWSGARQTSDPERKRGGRLVAFVFVAFAVLALTQVLGHPGAWQDAGGSSSSPLDVNPVPVVFGLLLMAVAAPSVWWGWASARWPTVDGEVVGCTVREQAGKGGRILYVPEVRYRYSVGAQSFTSRRWRFSLLGNAFGTPTAAYDALAGLVPGGPVAVFHHPRFPRL